MAIETGVRIKTKMALPMIKLDQTCSLKSVPELLPFKNAQNDQKILEYLNVILGWLKGCQKEC